MVWWQPVLGAVIGALVGLGLNRLTTCVGGG